MFGSQPDPIPVTKQLPGNLLAPDGSMTGQRDNLPVGGTYPADLWLAGEVVTDVHPHLQPVRARRGVAGTVGGAGD